MSGTIEHGTIIFCCIFWFMCAVSVFAFRYGRRHWPVWIPTLRIVARCIWVLQPWRPFLHESVVTTAHHLHTSSPASSEPACPPATTDALWSGSFHTIINMLRTRILFKWTWEIFQPFQTALSWKHVSQWLSLNFPFLFLIFFMWLIQSLDLSLKYHICSVSI